MSHDGLVENKCPDSHSWTNTCGEWELFTHPSALRIRVHRFSDYAFTWYYLYNHSCTQLQTYYKQIYPYKTRLPFQEIHLRKGQFFDAMWLVVG